MRIVAAALLLMLPLFLPPPAGAKQSVSVRGKTDRDYLEKRIGGKVVVEVTLDETGKVVSVRSIEGPAELRPAAEEAVMGWEFNPTYLSKVPVRVVGTITFNFNL